MPLHKSSVSQKDQLSVQESIVPVVLSKIYVVSHRFRGSLPRNHGEFCVSDKHMAFLSKWQSESAQPLGSELGGWRRSEIVLI